MPEYREILALAWELVSKPQEELDKPDFRLVTRYETTPTGGLKVELMDRGRLLERLLER